MISVSNLVGTAHGNDWPCYFCQAIPETVYANYRWVCLDQTHETAVKACPKCARRQELSMMLGE